MPSVNEPLSDSVRRAVLDDIIALARRRHADEIVTELEGMIAQLARRLLTVVVAGQYSRGKSTLVNALVGAALLPTGLLPVTAVPTIVGKGPHRVAHVVYLDGRRQEMSFAALADFVSEAGNPGNRRGVRRVELSLPEWSLDNVQVVDAPGISTPSDTDGQAADPALRLADLAVLVVGPEPPINAGELRFAATVANASQKLFVVLNKADLAGVDLDEVIDFTRARLIERLGFAPPLYALNARAAIGNAPGDPRFDVFRAAVAAFVEEHGTSTLGASIERRAAVLAHDLKRNIELERIATAAPRDARLNALAQLQSMEQELHMRRPEIMAAYKSGLADDLQVIEATIQEWIGPESRIIQERLDRFVASGDIDRVRDELDAAAADVVSRWSLSVQSRLEHIGRLRGGRLERDVKALRQELIVSVLAALGNATFLDTPNAPTFVIGPIRTAGDYATTGVELALQAAFHTLPKAMRVWRLRETLAQRIDERLDRERGQLLAASRATLQEANTSATRAVARWFEAELTTVRTAIDRAVRVDDRDVASRIAELHAMERSLFDGITILQHEPESSEAGSAR